MYAAIIIGFIVLDIVRNIFLVGFSNLASKTLHNKMFSHILHTPVEFFENQPVGKFKI